MSIMIDNMDLFNNCLDVISTPEGLKPVRFTQKQFLEYSKDDKLQIRSYCTAGICIDVITDSSFIKITYLINRRIREKVFFDIFVDDVFVDSISNIAEQQKGDITYYISKGKTGMRRITVYLPHNAEPVIQQIEFSEKANVEVAKKYDKNILCLGDSITQGMNALRPSSTYPVLLSRFLKMNLLNQGVGGYVFNVDSLDNNLAFEPNLITVAYGTNDWVKCKSYREFYTNCDVYMRRLTEIYKGLPIVVITPFWRAICNEVKETGTFWSIQEGIKEICSQYSNMHIVDGTKLVPNFPEYFGDQATHPNDEGFLHITMNLLMNLYGVKVIN